MAAVAVHLAQGGHRLGERGERCPGVGGFAALGAVFDDVLPPALRVVVARRLGEHADGVDRGPCGRSGFGGRVRRAHPAIRFPGPVQLLGPGAVRRVFRIPCHGQGMRRGQIDEPDRNAVFEAPADRDPFGREGGQRPERRLPRVVDGMGEQRDRWPHPLVGGQRQQRVRLRGTLDEHGARAGGLQRRADGAGRARSVVPHPQQQRSRGTSGPGHADTSRQAR